MSKPREVFVYYEGSVPAEVYPTEFPKPYEEGGILFREVTPADEAKDKALSEASELIRNPPKISSYDYQPWIRRADEWLKKYGTPEGMRTDE